MELHYFTKIKWLYPTELRKHSKISVFKNFRQGNQFKRICEILRDYGGFLEMPQKDCEGWFSHMRAYARKSWNAPNSNKFIFGPFPISKSMVWFFRIRWEKWGISRFSNIKKWGISRKNLMVDFEMRKHAFWGISRKISLRDWKFENLESIEFPIRVETDFKNSRYST